MAISVTSAGVNGLSVTSKTGVASPQPSAPSVGSFCWVLSTYAKPASIKAPSSGSYLSIIVAQRAGEWGTFTGYYAPSSYAGGATVISTSDISYTVTAVLYRTS